MLHILKTIVTQHTLPLLNSSVSEINIEYMGRSDFKQVQYVITYVLAEKYIGQ